MKKEYDFSKGERCKFYHPDLELYSPIYIEPEMMEILSKFSPRCQKAEKGTVTANIFFHCLWAFLLKVYFKCKFTNFK